MTHLTVVNGPRAGTQIELDTGHGATIGAADTNTIRVANPGVAATQAEVKPLKGGGFGVKLSDGPVTLNGRHVPAARLNDGDTLEVAGVRIVFGPPGVAADRMGKMIGGFRLLEVLGKGGGGTVYRAEQVSLHREVALKVLDLKLTSDPVFVARFVAEARAAARLQHPNVVQVYDVGHEGETYFYSMELMHDGSIEDRLRRDGKLPVDDALQAVTDAAKGLAYAESLRIVHRDIKPDNLMLDHHGHVKLADLGLALTDEESSDKVVGTPHFMSPEQILRRPLDHRSDLYSLGCTAYRMLAGRNPFTGATVKDILRGHVKEDAEPLNKVDAELPPEVSDLVARLMAKDPDERVQSATELLGELDEITSPPVRRGLLIGGIVAAVLVAASAVAWALTRPDKKEVITQTDPAAQAAAEAAAKRAREAEAEAAYFRVKSQDVAGNALAEALEAMADAHPDTEAAGRARTEADEVRTRVAAAAAAAAERRRRIEQAQSDLGERVRAHIGSRNYRDALSLLALEGVDEDIRGDAAIAATATTLRGEVDAAAGARLGELVGAVAEAGSTAVGGDLAPLRTALEGLSTAVEGDSAWPDGLAVDLDGARRALADGRATLQQAEAALAAAAEARAWQVLGDAGAQALATFARGNGGEAAATLQVLSEGDQAGSAAAGHAARLAAAMREAADWLQRYAAEVGQAELDLTLPGDDKPADVVGFGAPDGALLGFEVRGGGRGGNGAGNRHVPFDSLGDGQLSMLLRAAADGGERPAAAAAVAFLELDRHLRAARAYLARLDPDDDLSGTGAQAYVHDTADLRWAISRLEECDVPWARTVLEEAVAAFDLVSALRALGGQRNLAAAGYAERLLESHAHRIVVARLR